MIQQSEFRAPAAPVELPKPRAIYVQPAADNPNQAPLAVRQKLSEVCAGKCRNLAVEKVSGNRLRVAFLVRDQVEADMLTNLLGGLPELAAYKVDFEVQIGQ